MNPASRWTGVALGVSLSAALAGAQTTERVSVSSQAAQGNNHSQYSSLSADGRFVAFESYASNLVAGDTNGSVDAFVHDRQSGATERVSVNSSGAQGDANSYKPALSPDGRFVVFESLAAHLVAGDTNGSQDIFLRDRLLGTTERVSLDSGGAQGNGNSYMPALSADARFVAFSSAATNLVPGDTNGKWDVFVRDRQLGTTERVSVSSGGVEGDLTSGYIAAASLSADGRFVVFPSLATTLVAGDSNGAHDIFLRDRLLGTTERVSVGSGGGQAGGNSYFCSVSVDGRFVAFDSFAPNLVAGDTNGDWDVFLRDRLLGTTERISVATGGAEADLGGAYPSVSADGRFVAFTSAATNLVAGDTNGDGDVFLRDRLVGTTERVSLVTGGGQANNYSLMTSLSADGRFVAFTSAASNLVTGDTNGDLDVFVRDRGVLPPVAFCFGDGSAGACPCGNNGLAGRGCENSASSGGAVLGAAGTSALASDTLVLTSSGETPTAPSIFLQGNSTIAAANFGDGLRCIGGSLRRLYVHSAVGGAVSAPQAGDPPISARSAALGDVLTAGATRHYQTYYRDPNASFCPNPPGNTWNISSGLSVLWSP